MAELSEGEWTAFEKWLTSEIKDKTDADPEVVAEYIVALLKSHPDIKEAYERCLSDIPEFFAEGVNADAVLGGIFDALKSRTFLPQAAAAAQKKDKKNKNKKQLQPGADGPPELPAPGAWQTQPSRQPFHPLPQAPHRANRGFDPSALPFTPAGLQYGRGGRVVQISRKRGRDEDLDSPGVAAGGRDPHFGGGVGGERPMKQMRRGGRERGGRGAPRHDTVNGRGAHANGFVDQAFTPLPAMVGSAAPAAASRGGYAGFPLPGQAQQFSLDDMQNLLASLAAMSAAMGMPLPPDLPSANTNGILSADTRRPCFTFQKKGYCSRGSTCPYKHSFDDGATRAAQYGVNGSLASGTPPSTERRKRRGHAEFSSNQPPDDAEATSIVVEHIPTDFLSEGAVRDFYVQFGEITEIDLREHRALAIVRYADHESARKAWESPKVGFDNRFVRVYWYKPEMATDLGNEVANGNDPNHGYTNGIGYIQREEEMFDPEAFAKIAEERQKEHEEKQRKREELEAQRSEIASKLKTFINAKRELIDKLAEHDPHGLAEGEGGVGEQLTWEEKKNTEALRERLAALEAQAESLGLKGEEEEDFTRGFSTAFRGRGYMRGRGSFAPRARGYGGYRGSFHGSPRGGVMRLDNRPKSLVVSLSREDEGRQWTAEHDEALRSFLVAGYEFDGLANHPQRKDSQVVTFRERYMAEMFAAVAQNIPGIGPMWLAWAPKELSTITASAPASKVILKSNDEDLEDGEVDEQHGRLHVPEHAMADEEEDFDIA